MRPFPSFPEFEVRGRPGLRSCGPPHLQTRTEQAQVYIARLAGEGMEDREDHSPAPAHLPLAQPPGGALRVSQEAAGLEFT